MSPPQAASHAAADSKREQNPEGHSHHGEEKKAHDKPAHEFGSSGKPITTQADLTKKVEDE